MTTDMKRHFGKGKEKRPKRSNVKTISMVVVWCGVVAHLPFVL